MLGISRTLAYDLVARQELPSVRFGNRIYVPRDAVALFVGVGDEEPDAAGRAGTWARGPERPVCRRTDAGDARPPSPAPPELSRRRASQPRPGQPEPQSQLTLFEPTDQPTTATTPKPLRRSRRSTTRSSNATSQTTPDRALPPSNQPDALAPEVRRGPVNVAGNRAGKRSGLNGNLNAEAKPPC
jgi:hypothetical protein